MRARQCAWVTVLCVVAGGLLTAQSPLAPTGAEFDVASVRPTGDSRRPISIELNLMKREAAMAPGRFNPSPVPLDVLIQWAYDIRDVQVVGGPSWIRTDRYAVDAKAAANATFEQMRPMIRSLLADRFKLSVRRETRTIPVYELTPAAGGLKIAPMKEGDCVPFKSGGPMLGTAVPVFYCGGFRRVIVSQPPDRIDRVEAGGILMPALLDFIAEDIGRIVIDRTGFTAPFKVLLQFAPRPDLAVIAVSPSGPTLLSAMEDQLGLRLVATQGPVEVLVVDRVERPTEN